MGYRVHKDINNMFKVVEVSDGEVKDMIDNLTENKAKEISKKLNIGCGFNGFTPNFFLQRMSVSV